MARRSLRNSLSLGVALFTVLVAVLVAAHGYWVNERSEQKVWESMLRAEMDFFMERHAADPDYVLPASDILRVYRQEQAPPAFRTLPPGLHDELRLNGRIYVVLVQEREQPRYLLALDITEQEHGEVALAASLAASVMTVVLLLALIVYWGAGYLLRPLMNLSVSIARLPPDGSGAPLPVAARDPQEVAVVATAINDHQASIKAYVERERTFINLASHELRSPIAVVRSAMDVALGHPDMTPALRPHVLRAAASAKGMEELADMLLSLARNPERTLRDLQPVDVAAELPQIVADYALIAQEKELTLQLDIRPGFTVVAPASTLRSVVGNLLRNAIENSDRGVIRVYSEGTGAIVVEDSGHGMTDAEMAQLYSRIIRSGYTGTAGIGLGLISRICAHLGWHFALESSPVKGTKARIEFRAAP